jgi:hypothetical protein
MEQKKGGLSHLKTLQTALEQARRITGTGLTEAGKQLTAMVAEAVREGVHRLVGLLEALILHLPTKDAAAREEIRRARQTKKDETAIAEIQVKIRKAMEEAAQAKCELREGLAELDEQSQKELEQAIIMSACPGSPTCGNLPDFPNKADQFFRSFLTAEEKKRLGWLMGRLGGTTGAEGEAKLLQGAALALRVFLPEEGTKWNPECFRVDHEKPLGENIAVGFLNGFLPKREQELAELLKALENTGDEEVPVGNDEKLGLKALLLTIRELRDALPKSLPEWAKKLYDEIRAKRLKPQSAEQPKTKKTQEPELPIVTKIKTFVSCRGIKLDEGARKCLFSAVETVKKGGEVAEPLKWLTAAQKGLPDEIAKELDNLMEEVRKHYRQQKANTEAKAEPKPQPPTKPPAPPLKKEDVAMWKADREVVRWLTEQVLLGRWDDLTDETRRRLKGLAFDIQRIVPMRVVEEEIGSLETELGESFAGVFAELRERYEADRAKTYASCQAAKANAAPKPAPKAEAVSTAEVPASPAGGKVEAPPATESAGRPSAEKAAEETPKPTRQRFTRKSFNKQANDPEVIAEIKAWVRRYFDGLSPKILGSLNQTCLSIKNNGPVERALSWIGQAKRELGSDKRSSEVAELEVLVKAHYESPNPTPKPAAAPVDAAETK